MNHLKSFEAFNESSDEKWIQKAIRKPGSLRKKLGKKKGEKITMSELESEIDKLEAKDKDKDKPGTQLNKKGAKKKRQLELAKTLKDINN